MNTPKLSIITVNLNNAEGLEKTIQNVINQTFTNYEYIIIDGNVENIRKSKLVFAFMLKKM